MARTGQIIGQAMAGLARLEITPMVVTLVSISKIIREAKTFNTGMSIHGFITVII